MKERCPGVRIHSLKMENFKGFHGEVEIPMDADLILLLGGNGRGKTSTIEALELALTGDLRRRVGDPSDFDLRGYISRRHRANSAKAKGSAGIEVLWQGGAGTSRVEIENRRRLGLSHTHSGEIGRLAGLGKWGEPTRRLLLQTSTFLYSDLLGSLMGLDQRTRMGVLDLFLPVGKHLQRLVEQEASGLEALAQRGRERAQIMDRRVLIQERLRAVEALQRAWEPATATPLEKLAGKQDLLKSAAERLRAGLRMLGTEPSGDDSKISKLLEALMARCQLELDALRSGESLPRAALPTGWGGVEAGVRRIQHRRRAIGPDALSAPSDADRATLELSSALWAQQREDLERDGRRRLREVHAPFSGAGYLQAMTLGTIPLLASLRDLAAEDDPPGWVRDLLTVLPPHRVEGLLREEEANLRQVQYRLEVGGVAERERGRELEHLNTQQAVKDAEVELRRAWETVSTEPVPELSPGQIDLAAIHTAAARDNGASGGNDLEIRTGAWTKLAKCAERWRDIEDQLQAYDERCAMNESLGSFALELEGLKEVSGSLGNTKAGYKDSLRSAYISSRIGDSFNSAMGAFIERYAHLEDVRLRTRMLIDTAMRLEVAHGEGSDVSSGLTTLSRSQLSSIALSMGMAANLGQRDLLSGFFCLDDVSDAFDLDNVAADAAILRSLAYGEGPTRRQLILTNHNAYLTDRLVPLLLPPAGRSMRIIEFTDGPDGIVQVTPWNVESETSQAWTGRSPLRALFPPL